jgi:hypothetical protein
MVMVVSIEVSACVEVNVARGRRRVEVTVPTRQGKTDA